MQLNNRQLGQFTVSKNSEIIKTSEDGQVEVPSEGADKADSDGI